jgi:microcystin-dependent protein
MGENFIGEIRAFSFNWAPYGWSTCQGQTMQMQQNMALYALLGTLFGGDGKTTFCLPDLQGRTVLNEGTSDDGTYYPFAAKGGVEAVTLTTTNAPPHAHLAKGNSATTGNVNSPAGAAFSGNATKQPYAPPAQLTRQPLNGQTLSVVGGAAHNNMQPSLTINYCIALTGYFPPRQ